MRDYLYIWHDIGSNSIIASGIEFESIANQMVPNRGIILLNHNSENAKFDDSSRFEYVPPEKISDLTKEDIYSWGDFCWIDYESDKFPKLSKKQISEILYFEHKAEPFDDIRLSCLNNKFMCYAHDDGWFLKMFYHNFSDVVGLIRSLDLSFDHNELISSLEHAKAAYWISSGKIEVEQITLDIDKVLNQRL